MEQKKVVKKKVVKKKVEIRSKEERELRRRLAVLEARLDRIVAAMSTAKRITKDM